MKKLKQSLLLLLSGLLLSACAQQTTQNSESESVLESAQSQYLGKVDTNYSYELALKLETYKTNEQLGYRTAGSQAEFLTGEMLKEEMESIGLQNVTKDEFMLDGWTFEKAELTVNTSEGEKTLILGGYQTNFNTNGAKEFTIIYANQGTEADLANLDVTDKLVLVDINQRDNWWINYPAYEAHLNGAAAIIAAQDGGYGTISDEALNTQDVCGPKDAPAFSISAKDAKLIRDTMAENNTNELTVTFDAKSIVENDVKSYNISGFIPGKSDEMILMSAHYDSYFVGFQDDNAAIALMLGIAKGIIDSGYEPNHTLVFTAMAAEEWGVENTRYDWSTGAYNQIFRIHPEWVGNVMADINFELPAMLEGTSDQIRASYELKTFLEEFKTTVPTVEDVFEDGIEIIVPTQTWSDDFSLSIAGIPSTVTALRGGFSETTYHSQFDNKDTYSKEAFLFHHNLYGMLMLAYDHMMVSPLDFSTRLIALKSVSNHDALSLQQQESLNNEIDKTLESAQSAWNIVQQSNQEYLNALNNNDQQAAQKIANDYQALRSNVLSTFKFVEDNLVRLTWEDSSQFPHEHSANNIAAIQGAIEALKNSNPQLALDEYLYLVDNNWYAYDWSEETFDYFTDYVLNQPADRLMWGAGRVQGHTNLFDVINSLQEKSPTDDFAEEIAYLNTCLEKEYAMLQNQIDLELSTIQELNNRLNTIAE